MKIELDAKHSLIIPKYRKKALHEALGVVNNPNNYVNEKVVESWAIAGECYKYEQNPTSTAEAYDYALNLAEKMGDNELIGSILNHFADAMYFCNEYRQAITYYEEALNIINRSGNMQDIVTIYSQLAYSSEKLSERDKERTFLKSGMSLPEIDPLIKANFVERFALSLAASNEYEEAIYKYEEALSMYASQDFGRNWQERVTNLADIYHANGDEDGARKTLERLDFFDKKGDLRS